MKQIKSGIGFEMKNDGQIYIGEFIKDSYNGYGLMMNSDNNSFYIGQFENTIPKGHGIIKIDQY